MKNKIIKDALVLLAITLVSGVALGLVYEVTKDPIARELGLPFRLFTLCTKTCSLACFQD